MAKDETGIRYRLIGTRPDRPDGLDKVTGRARYGADISLPGMLHGVVVRSPHAHARIRGIDASRALALPGVKAVVTRADLPTGLTGEDWNLQENTLAGEKALYDGHAVAAVAATTRLIALEAAKLVHVDYEVLPHVTDVDAAMAPGAPVIREGTADHSVPEGMHPNIVRAMDFGRGDIDAGFAEADLVREHTYRTEAPIRATSNPMPAWPSLAPTAKGRCGSARRASGSSAACAPPSSGSRRRTCASPPPKSAAASAARPPSSWNPCRLPCRRRPAAARSRWSCPGQRCCAPPAPPPRPRWTSSWA